MTALRTRVLSNPFFWLLLIMLALEITAFYLLPYRSIPVAETAVRNPLQKRGWPEYTRGKSSQEGKLVVIISNSQGIGKEITAPGSTYSGLLRERLKAMMPEVLLENWSCAGIRTADIEMLSLRAVERKADLVLFVLSFENLDPVGKVNLEFPSSDVKLLAAVPSLWRHFPQTQFFRRLTPRTAFENFFSFRSRLIRSRIDVLESLANLLPREAHRYVFGQELRSHRRLDGWGSEQVGGEETTLKCILEKKNRGGAFKVKEERLEQSRETFSQVYPTLAKRLDSRGIRHVWVWQPLALDNFKERSINHIRHFVEGATGTIETAGGRSLDLTGSIPTRHFYSRGHFDQHGHELMSSSILPVIADELR